MLYYALVFLLVALVAGAFGFLSLAGTSSVDFESALHHFLVLFVGSLLTRRPV